MINREALYVMAMIGYPEGDDTSDCLAKLLSDVADAYLQSITSEEEDAELRAMRLDDRLDFCFSRLNVLYTEIESRLEIGARLQ